jgi:hypothetical protein
MKLDRRYTAGWILWGLLFVVLEGSALLIPADAPNGTLTWNLRELLALGSRTQWAGRALAVAVLAWLCWHFLYPKNDRRK